MVLTKEEFLTKIKERIGENPTDEDISFVEDMTDTIDSLSQGDEWKKKFEENVLSYFSVTKRRVQGGVATSERRRRDG